MNVYLNSSAYESEESPINLTFGRKFNRDKALNIFEDKFREDFQRRFYCINVFNEGGLNYERGLNEGLTGSLKDLAQDFNSNDEKLIEKQLDVQSKRMLKSPDLSDKIFAFGYPGWNKHSNDEPWKNSSLIPYDARIDRNNVRDREEQKDLRRIQQSERELEDFHMTRRNDDYKKKLYDMTSNNLQLVDMPAHTKIQLKIRGKEACLKVANKKYALLNLTRHMYSKNFSMSTQYTEHQFVIEFLDKKNEFFQKYERFTSTWIAGSIIVNSDLREFYRKKDWNVNKIQTKLDKCNKVRLHEYSYFYANIPLVFNNVMNIINNHTPEQFKKEAELLNPYYEKEKQEFKTKAMEKLDANKFPIFFTLKRFFNEPELNMLKKQAVYLANVPKCLALFHKNNHQESTEVNYSLEIISSKLGRTQRSRTGNEPIQLNNPTNVTPSFEC